MKVIHESRLFRYLNVSLDVSEISKVYYLHETDKYFNREVEIVQNHMNEQEFFFFIKNKKTEFDTLRKYLEYAFSHEFLKTEMRKWKLKQLMNKEGS